MGEEFVGVVEEAGSETAFQKGDHVAGWIYGGGKVRALPIGSQIILRSALAYVLRLMTVPTPNMLSVIPGVCFTFPGLRLPGLFLEPFS